MTPHGPDTTTFENAVSTADQPQHLGRDTLAFMFETHLTPRVTPAAMSSPSIDRDYYKCWLGLKSHFDRNWWKEQQQGQGEVTGASASSHQQQQQLKEALLGGGRGAAGAGGVAEEEEDEPVGSISGPLLNGVVPARITVRQMSSQEVLDECIISSPS